MCHFIQTYPGITGNVIDNYIFNVTDPHALFAVCYTKFISVQTEQCTTGKITFIQKA